MARHTSLRAPAPPPVRRLLLLFGLLVICAVSASSVTAVHANFTGTTLNRNNVLGSGTITIDESHGAATAPFVVTGAQPGNVLERCVRVRSTGSLDAELRHYLQASGALLPHLQLRVTRGTVSTGGTSTSCTGFTADTGNYVGQGAGVLYSGALASYGTTWDTGVPDRTGAATPVTTETWTTGESHDYQLRITVQNDPVVQGNKNARITFVWEARNR